MREHLLRGYTLNERRLREKGFGEIEQAVGLLARTLTRHELVTGEGAAVLDVVQQYTRAWQRHRHVPRRRRSGSRCRWPETLSWGCATRWSTTGRRAACSARSAATSLPRSSAPQGVVRAALRGGLWLRRCCSDARRADEPATQGQAEVELFEKVGRRPAKKKHVRLPMMRVMRLVMRPFDPMLSLQITGGILMDTENQAYDMSATLQQYPAKLTRLEKIARQMVDSTKG